MLGSAKQQRLAREAVQAIIKGLSDFRGLRHEWEKIDIGIQREIVRIWTRIVIDALVAYARSTANAHHADLLRLREELKLQ